MTDIRLRLESFISVYKGDVNLKNVDFTNLVMAASNERGVIVYRNDCSDDYD